MRKLALIVIYQMPVEWTSGSIADNDYFEPNTFAYVVRPRLIFSVHTVASIAPQS